MLAFMIVYLTSGDWAGLMSDLAVRTTIILLCWATVVASVFIDLWSGVDTAKALGEKIISSGLRRTVTKIGDYMRVMLFMLMFDILGSFLTFYTIPYATMLGALAIILIEGKSVIENARKKKSASAEIPDIIAKIVNAKNYEQAKDIVRELSGKDKV